MFIQTWGHSCSTRTACLHGADQSCTQGRKHVFCLNAWRISRSPASLGRPFHVMLVRTSMASESQDATKITSALADPRIYSSMKMMTLNMHMHAIIIFSVVLWQCRHQDSLMSVWQAIRTRNQFMKATNARSLEALIAGRKSNTLLTLKMKVK